MSIKEILKKIKCKIFCCFKSSCSYNENDIDNTYNKKK